MSVEAQFEKLFMKISYDKSSPAFHKTGSSAEINIFELEEIKSFRLPEKLERSAEKIWRGLSFLSRKAGFCYKYKFSESQLTSLLTKEFSNIYFLVYLFSLCNFNAKCVSFCNILSKAKEEKLSIPMLRMMTQCHFPLPAAPTKFTPNDRLLRFFILQHQLEFTFLQKETFDELLTKANNSEEIIELLILSVLTEKQKSQLHSSDIIQIYPSYNTAEDPKSFIRIYPHLYKHLKQRPENLHNEKQDLDTPPSLISSEDVQVEDTKIELKKGKLTVLSLEMIKTQTRKRKRDSEPSSETTTEEVQHVSKKMRR